MSEWQSEFKCLLTQCAGRAFGELRDTSDGGLSAGVAPEFFDVLFRPCAALRRPSKYLLFFAMAKISCEKDHLSRNDAITKVFYK